MEYWKKLGCASAIAVSAGCAGGSSLIQAPVHAESKRDLSTGAGSVYDDIFHYKPRDAESFSNAGEIDGAIKGLRRRLLFAAGPDKAEGIIMQCESGSGIMLCPVNETQRVIENVNIFSQAVTNCYAGRKLSDGRPDPGYEGQLDLDCFVSAVKSIEPVKGVNHGMECQKALYECYKTGYAGIVKSL